MRRLLLIVLSLCLLSSSPLLAGAEDSDVVRESRVWDLNAEEKLYSQGHEELIIRHFFGDRREGFFLDVGCFHWKWASTTNYLEQHLGWSGAGIDALASMKLGYDKHRKKTLFLNYLVSDESGGTETLYVAGPLSSTDGDRIEAWGKEKKPVEVERITLNDLLQKEGIDKIDFLSMDIEGGEAAALRGFDIERFAPELVCIEISPPNREEVSKYFADHGYTLLEQYREYDPTNFYYARAGGGDRPETEPTAE